MKMKTRSSDASQDLKANMPVKDRSPVNEEDGESDNSNERSEKDGSFPSNGGSLWGRELRNRFVFSTNDHMRPTRAITLHARYAKPAISSSRHIRSCRFNDRRRVYDDEIIDSDVGIFDDDDELFSPARKRRESSRRPSERRRERRTHVHERALRSSSRNTSPGHHVDHGSRMLHPRHVDEVVGDEEGEEEEEEEEEVEEHQMNGHDSSVDKQQDENHEGEDSNLLVQDGQFPYEPSKNRPTYDIICKKLMHGGVRRSTRQRKLLYDNFNTSWILGLSKLRGYPMYMVDKGGPRPEAITEDQSVEQERDGDRKETMKKRRAMSQCERPGDDVSKDRASIPRSTYSYEDMYTRVKRPRRAAQNALYSEEKTKSRSRKLTGVCEDDPTETQSTSSSDNESFGDGTERGRRCRKYHLRKTKPIVERFQASAEPPRPSRILRSVLCNSVRRRMCRPAHDDSSSSSSEEERFDRKKVKERKGDRKRFVPLNIHLDDITKSGGDGKHATTLADTNPMVVDKSIGFGNVGGLENHIRCLQEMVVFPMLYREVFEKFGIHPPRGVLFHGPPGTGKTLIARALANECSQGDRKVSFFMRRGADILSKWVGESERQLRLLFEQAYQMRPSIIFFDEIDGLAPVRSAKQDQIHASIVSTLLALMDGIDDRGEIIVIGATNRIDAIDPALRRPGRFDRELFFPLPARKERHEILKIHVSKWAQPPGPSLLNTLAEQAVGYCGSDLRALCAEAVIQGLRRKYPQIYKSSQRLLLDTEAIKVEKIDFMRARSKIVPTAHRVMATPARKLSLLVEPLLRSTFEKCVNLIKDAYPYIMATNTAQLSSMDCVVYRPRFLMVGKGGKQGQTSYLGPALLHKMEHIPSYLLDFGTLFEVSGRSPEETCVQIFREARRQPPSIVYVPCIDQLWELTSDTMHAVFLSNLQQLDPHTPILLLATSHTPYADLPDELQDLFSAFRSETLDMRNPLPHERELFFKEVLLTDPVRPPRIIKKKEPLPELPLAPPPEPPKLSETELKEMYEKEERTLRELRIFLREVCSKLARNRQFFMFSKPVDILEVPDYLTIIKQPMDLETMMTKIDLHRYACAKDFLDDVDLLVRNALEYNPDRDPADKLIRHRACSLRDTAYALIKAEMDSDFEDKCQGIAKARRMREESPSRFAPDFIHTKPVKNESGESQDPFVATSSQESKETVQSSPDSAGESNTGVKTPWKSVSEPRMAKRRCSAWARGMLTCKKKKSLPARSSTANNSSPNSSPRGASDSRGKHGNESPGEVCVNGVHTTKLGHIDHEKGGGSLQKSSSDPDLDLDDFEETGDDALSICDTTSQEGCDLPQRLEGESSSNTIETKTDSKKKEVTISVEKLRKLLDKTVHFTDGYPVESLIELKTQFSKCISKFSRLWDRTTLPLELDKDLERFRKYYSHSSNLTAS